MPSLLKYSHLLHPAFNTACSPPPTTCTVPWQFLLSVPFLYACHLMSCLRAQFLAHLFILFIHLWLYFSPRVLKMITTPRYIPPFKTSLQLCVFHVSDIKICVSSHSIYTTLMSNICVKFGTYKTKICLQSHAHNLFSDSPISEDSHSIQTKHLEVFLEYKHFIFTL